MRGKVCEDDTTDGGWVTARVHHKTYVFGKRKTTTPSSDRVGSGGGVPYSTLGVKPDPFARRVPTEAAAAQSIYGERLGKGERNGTVFERT